MTNSLHFSEWRNCIRAQRKVNLCAPGAPKGPKVGMFVRQYEIVCANDAGRAPRKYPEQGGFNCPLHSRGKWYQIILPYDLCQIENNTGLIASLAQQNKYQLIDIMCTSTQHNYSMTKC